MANLIKLDTNEYPVSTTEFLSRFPQTSFPAQINYAEFGYAVVFPAPPPTFDPITQYAREIAPELTNKGTWEQRYEIIDYDAETVAENRERAYRASIPQSVTMRQARLALLAAGVLDQVDAAVASVGPAAVIEWEYATDVDRDWPLVVQLGAALSLNVDELFIAAGKR